MEKIKLFFKKKNYKTLEWFRKRLEAPSDAQWSWVIDQLFNKIAWLNRKGEDKKEISLAITEGIKIDKVYWLEIILSSLIATFGLIQNSVAVIIGAMLIAPLLRPIQAIAFAIANGRHKLFWKSSRVLFLSLILGIIISFLVSRFLPVVTENSEITSRIAPNLIDLLIAISSAMIALLAFAYKRLYASVAGVAMATALMPPISVIGIEIFLGNWGSAWGSFLLFFTNLSSILIIGAFMFIFYGFNPHQENSKKTIRNLFVLGVIIIALWITLSSSLHQIRENIDFKEALKNVFTRELETLVPKAKLNQFDFRGSDKSEKLKIIGEIKLPEDVVLYTGILDEMVDDLSNNLKKEVQLDLDIVRIATIKSKNTEQTLEEKIEQHSRDIFEKNFPDVLIINQEIINLFDNKWSIKTVYTLPNGIFMDDWMQNKIEESIKNKFPTEKISFVWGDLPQREMPKTVEEPTVDELWFSDFKQRWEQFFQDNLPKNVSIDNLEIKWKKEDKIKKVFIYFDIQIPKNYNNILINEFNENLKKYTEDFNNIDIKVFPRIFEYASAFPLEEILTSELEENDTLVINNDI